MLKVIGIGPGDINCFSLQAIDAIKEADVVAGYKLYIEQIPSDLLQGKKIISNSMMQEIDRCNEALDCACNGLETVLVCSGDSGVYALASLVYELNFKRNLELEIEVIPGIPALCAAASLLGAPLTHDFACISLSDLLTPWDVIEKRVKHALEADFVLVIYNPKSKKRNWQFEKVLELAKEIQKDVPLGLVKNAYRDGQETKLTNINDFDDLDFVDMLTIAIIGSSQTSILDDKMVTSRGYLQKYKV